jgi:hypothetical protein
MLAWISERIKGTPLFCFLKNIEYFFYPLYLWFQHIDAHKPRKPGIRPRCGDETEVIISLTSFPARIPYLHHCLYSLMNQTIHPHRIILWLAEEQFPDRLDDIPEKIRELQPLGLEIRWVKQDLRSYKKLIPALNAFPEAIIVTADDDLYYPDYWLERLINAYQKHPDSIHCHLITRLGMDSQKIIDQVPRSRQMVDSFSYFNKLLGGSGTLYPPHILSKNVFDLNVMRQTAPSSDDVWFWAMAVLNHKTIHWIPNGMRNLVYVEYTQEDTPTLSSVNDTDDQGFRKHINAVADHYHLRTILTTEVSGRKK